MASNDTKEITTPNGRVVVIRNYTTHGDDKQAARLLNQGLDIQTDADGEPVVKVSGEASAASEAKYVELLVQSIDGDSNDIPKLLDGLRSEDYQAVAVAVREVTAVPKATTKS